MGHGASVNKPETTEVEVIQSNKKPSNEKTSNTSNATTASNQNILKKTNSKNDLTRNCVKCTQLKLDLDLKINNLNDLEAKYRQLVVESDKTRKDLVNLQNENIQLVEEINSLEFQLEMFTGQNTSMSIKEDFQKLMEIKDKKIAELENELSNEEKQADELKSKYISKLKKLKGKMDTLKKENAVKLVEMRDEINQLKGENELLTGKLKLFAETQTSNDNTKLIIELSNHISEKDIMIMQLNNELEEKENKIIKLEADFNQFKKKFSNLNHSIDTDRDYYNNTYNTEANTTILSEHKLLVINSRYNSAPTPVDLNRTLHPPNKPNSRQALISRRINVKEFATMNSFDSTAANNNTIDIGNNTTNDGDNTNLAALAISTNKTPTNYDYSTINNTTDLLDSSVSTL